MIKLPATSSQCAPDGGGSQLENALLLKVGGDALQGLARPGFGRLPRLPKVCRRQPSDECEWLHDSQQDQTRLQVPGSVCSAMGEPSRGSSARLYISLSAFLLAQSVNLANRDDK
jgi:hypothetical protein